MNRNIVRLKIISEKVSGEEITKLIHLKPTYSWKPGEFRPKTQIVQKTHGWIYTSLLPESSSIEAHAIDILETVSPSTSEIFGLSQIAEIEMSFVVYAERVPSLYFKKDIIDRAAKLGAHLDIDLYITHRE